MNTVSFKQYIEEIADPKIKKSIRTYGIIGYILAGINLILAIAFVPLGIIDVLWITGLSLGIHLGKSRVCAIIFLILGIISCGLATVQNGSLSGYWIPLLGICAVIEFNKAYKEYKNYLQQQQIQQQQFYY